jgi:hypothetical protein
LIAAIMLFLGWCLLIAILIPLCGYGMVAFSPHSNKCPCSGCVRKRERVQAEYDRMFPHPPGTVLKTYGEWLAEWEEDESPA